MGKMKDLDIDRRNNGEGWIHPNNLQVEAYMKLQLETGYPYECVTCLTYQESMDKEQHFCGSCGEEISGKRCSEHGGLCPQCEWLIDK